MDKIEAIKSKSPYMGDREHLCIFINGERFDEFLSNNVCCTYLGLIPSWLDYYNDDIEKEYVWEQTKLDSIAKVLPIMLCPDDFDFSCAVVVVEVINEPGTVIWNRMGVDKTEFDPCESELPKYIGKTVEWFANIRPMVFNKDEYLLCVEKFRAEKRSR